MVELRRHPRSGTVTGVARDVNHQVACWQTDRPLAVVTSLAPAWFHALVVKVRPQSSTTGLQGLQVGEQTSDFGVNYRLPNDGSNYSPKTLAVTVTATAIAVIRRRPGPAVPFRHGWPRLHSHPKPFIASFMTAHACCCSHCAVRSCCH